MRVLTNIESALRDWLVDQPAVNAVVGRKVFIGIPPELGRNEGAYPMVGLHRLYSVVHPYLGVDDAAVQLDCWGPMKSQRSAYTAAQAVTDCLWSMVPNTPLTTEVVAKGVHDLSTQWGPDPISDRPRYVVSVTVAAVATT